MDLNYDSKYNLTGPKTVLQVPDFQRTAPRKTTVPGMNMCMVDPTGYSFIEDSSLGFDGQGYGLASFKKGLKPISTCDILKANQSGIDLKEHRQYDQLPFKKILGRSQVDLKGRRTDLGVTANSVTRYDIKEMPA